MVPKYLLCVYIVVPIVLFEVQPSDALSIFINWEFCYGLLENDYLENINHSIFMFFRKQWQISKHLYCIFWSYLWILVAVDSNPCNLCRNTYLSENKLSSELSVSSYLIKALSSLVNAQFYTIVDLEKCLEEQLDILHDLLHPLFFHINFP